MERLDPPVMLLGRLLMATIFIVAAIGKITGYAGTQQYMQAYGVPGALLPLVIFVELGGGLALVSGLLTRTAALGLAVFTLIAGCIFHSHFADQTQQIMFMKNLAMAGGLLFLFVKGPGAWSLDQRLGLRF